MATTNYGRYLTPDEAKSGKYKGQVVTVNGGIRFKSPDLEPKQQIKLTGTQGRYLTPEESKSGKYAGQTIKVGNGIKFIDKAYEPTGGSTSTQTPSTTGNSEYDTILTQMKGLLDELKTRGQGINPDVQITPETAAEFMKIAEGEINPYYKTQLGLAREGFLSSLGYSAEQITANEANLERQYGQAQKQVAANAADTGFALSGQRQMKEQTLAQDTQAQIDSNRNELTQRSTDLARAFAQNYGGEAGFDINNIVPKIGAKPQVSTEGFSRNGQSSGLYQLSPDLYNNLIGTQEFNRRAAISTRNSELEQAFRQGKSLDQLRSLTI